MDKQSIFAAWAPEGSLWSQWAKGTVFAGINALPEVWAGEVFAPVDAAWAPEVRERGGMVLDLGGEEGVMAALALAERGYRPVPVYNALPGLTPGVLAGIAVDMSGLVRGLVAGAERMAGMRIGAAAPPVFLLDAARRGERVPGAGDFDNRSVSFPTDFPSGNFLRNSGIGRLMVVQRGRRTVQDDLAHTLRGWQESGVELMSVDLNEGTAMPLAVPEISRLRWMMERMAMRLGFRRSRLGGYGDVIPVPSAG